jgi:hypothetical protein
LTNATIYAASYALEAARCHGYPLTPPKNENGEGDHQMTTYVTILDNQLRLYDDGSIEYWDANTRSYQTGLGPHATTITSGPDLNTLVGWRHRTNPFLIDDI